jgi:hypothetical protein
VALARSVDHGMFAVVVAEALASAAVILLDLYPAQFTPTLWSWFSLRKKSLCLS